jgi:UDP-glucuronate decarboxylase
VSKSDCPGSSEITWHTVDLLDTDSSAKLLENISATHLIHLAWITEPGVYWQSTDNARWQDASIELLKNFAAQGGKRAVLAGTCAEYDWSAGHCVEECTPLLTQSPYTTAKLAFHDAAFAFSETTDLEIAWGRVFYSFGPHEHPQRLIAAVIRGLLDGERVACSDGEQLRDFIYVRDLADAFVAVLNSKFCGDINLASGEVMSIKELVTLVANRMDAIELVDFGARARQQGEPPIISADTSRLRELVGWTSKYNIEAAIDETIAWWKKKGNTT